MTKAEKLKYCQNCRDNFYNGHNDIGVSECWNLRSAKIVWKKEVGLWQRPPWNQKAVRVLSCYGRKGFVYVGPDQTC